MTVMTPTPELQEAQPITPAQDAQTAPALPTTPRTPEEPPRATPYGQSPSTPPVTTGRAGNWFLPLLGLVLAIGAGMTLEVIFDPWFTSLRGPTMQEVWWAALIALGFIAWTAIAASLFRSWWALLIVPVAFYAGFVVVPLLRSGFDFGPWFQSFVPGGRFAGRVILLLILPPTIVGALIGSPLGKLVARSSRG